MQLLVHGSADYFIAKLNRVSDVVKFDKLFDCFDHVTR